MFPDARAANNLSKFPEPGLGQPVVTLEVGAARDPWYASLVPRAWHRPQLKYIRTDCASLEEVMLWREILWTLRGKIPNKQLIGCAR